MALSMAAVARALPGCCSVSSPATESPASRSSRVVPGVKQLQRFEGFRATCNLPLAGASRSAGEQLRQMVADSLRSNTQGSRGVISCDGGMNLVFVSAEVAPWSKTGGLGDVLGGLPPALAARGHRVMTVSPRYDQYRDAWDTDVTVDVKVGNKIETVRFFHCYKRGVDRVFVDHPLFLAKVYGKTGGKLYGPTTGEDFLDNQLRFSLFCQAALEAPRVLNLNSNPYFSGTYGEDVTFVANDWHTALVPCYLKDYYKPRGMYQNAKVAFCVHNMAYQGRFAPTDFHNLNLSSEIKTTFDFYDGYSKPVKGNKLNWMKAGFLNADVALTVSPNYASEIVSGPERGVELDDVVAKKGVKGIVNGMDVQEWDPSADKYIDTPYDKTNVLQVKPSVKEALQAEVGLPVRPDVPVVAFIGRLEEQKGSDILAEAVDEIMQNDVQLIVLGTGKKYLEKQLEQLEVKYPEKARGVVKFNVPLAHMMTAGADFMLVPSRFEPCGLIQLHAMRYGTIPIVASTGGLVDTVKEGVTGFHMGAFNVDTSETPDNILTEDSPPCEAVDPADVAACAKGVAKAVSTFGTPQFEKMVLNCMEQDLSWKGPARIWESTLLELSKSHPEIKSAKAGKEGDEIAPKAKANLATP